MLLDMCFCMPDEKASFCFCVIAFVFGVYFGMGLDIKVFDMLVFHEFGNLFCNIIVYYRTDINTKGRGPLLKYKISHVRPHLQLEISFSIIVWWFLSWFFLPNPLSTCTVTLTCLWTSKRNTLFWQWNWMSGLFVDRVLTWLLFVDCFLTCNSDNDLLIC